MTTNIASGGRIWTPSITNRQTLRKLRIKSKVWLSVALFTLAASAVLAILTMQGQYFAIPEAVTTDTSFKIVVKEVSIVGQALAIGAASMFLLGSISTSLAFNPKRFSLEAVVVGMMVVLLAVLSAVMFVPGGINMNRSVDIQTWFSDTLGVSNMPAVSLKDGAVEDFLGSDSKIYTLTTQRDGDQLTLTTALAETPAETPQEEK